MITNENTTASLKELMGSHCAPALLGQKTGNLICLRAECFACLHGAFLQLRRELLPLGVRIETLHRRDGAVLLYVYRPALLRADLRRPMARRILRSLGYARGDVIARLRERLRQEDFPHEIGLFLGYPPEDVRGFIENRGANCKLCGCWKVYGDVEGAREAFARFESCRRAFLACIERGMAVEEIVRAGAKQKGLQERERKEWTRSA